MTTISLIAAVSEDGFIGRNGEIPWHIKGDWKFFKDMTINKPIVMGRVTFETLPEPLPKRPNIVVTRQKDWEADGVSITHTLTEAIELARTMIEGNLDEEATGEIMICGGENIYREALPLADKLYLTDVHMTVGDGDARFPDFDKSGWKITETIEGTAAPTDTAAYTINIYERV